MPADLAAASPSPATQRLCCGLQRFLDANVLWDLHVSSMFRFIISAVTNVCSDDLPNESILDKEGVKFRFLTQGVSEENIFHGNIHKSIRMDNLNICIPNKIANINNVILFKPSPLQSFHSEALPLFSC